MSLISAEGTAQIQLARNEPRLQTMTIIKPEGEEGYVYFQNQLIQASRHPNFITQLFCDRGSADAPYCPGLARDWQRIIERTLETDTHLAMAYLYTLHSPDKHPWEIFSLGTQPLPILIKSHGYYHTGVFLAVENGLLTCRITSPLVIGRTLTGDFIFAYRGWNNPWSIPGVAFVGVKLDLFEREIKSLHKHIQSLGASRIIVQLEIVS